jgi:hypothetical protein
LNRKREYQKTECSIIFAKNVTDAVRLGRGPVFDIDAARKELLGLAVEISSCSTATWAFMTARTNHS